jgi:4-hydroxybenzoate polyprenyltransferase
MDIPLANHTTSQGTKLSGIIRLSRWREHVPFTIPLTLAGGLLATEAIQTTVDWRLFAVIVANILAMSFAFMINDVEDAPDDALNPKKKMHNVISSGILTRREGWIVTWATCAISFVLYGISGIWTLILGGVMLVLCYLYSAHPFRLKARPLTDVISHILMLSGLLIMAGYFAYDNDPQHAWFVIIAAILVSAYGQFYNQIDDYEVDKAAGLKNTVVLLGRTPTLILSYASLIGAVGCMAIAVLQGIFPDWLGTILVIGILTTIIFPWEFDMRGNPASDGGNIQRPALVVANMITLAWVASSLGFLIVA